MNQKRKQGQIRKRRAGRTRAKISGDPKMPRLSVFRSNRFIYAQLIDDEHGRTLASASSRATGKDSAKKKTEKAKMVGEMIAKKAKELGIDKAVFDRGAYRYHGRVRSVAEGAREGGLKI